MCKDYFKSEGKILLDCFTCTHRGMIKLRNGAIFGCADHQECGPQFKKYKPCLEEKKRPVLLND